MPVIQNPITSPMHNDLVYLLLHNASSRPIRVSNVAQLSVAYRLLQDGYLEGEPDKGMVITEKGKVLMPALRKPHPDMTLAQIKPPKRGRKRAETQLGKRVKALNEQINTLRNRLALKDQEIEMQRTEIRQLRAYTGTDIHITALLVENREKDEQITGLRATIEKLREG